VIIGRSFDTHELQVCVVSFGLPPWEGGDAEVHLAERNFTSKRLLGCDVAYSRSNCHNFIRPTGDVTCPGCAAMLVARIMASEG
jgi:hypothetical protein